MKNSYGATVNNPQEFQLFSSHPVWRPIPSFLQSFLKTNLITAHVKSIILRVTDVKNKTFPTIKWSNWIPANTEKIPQECWKIAKNFGE